MSRAPQKRRRGDRTCATSVKGQLPGKGQRVRKRRKKKKKKTFALPHSPPPHLLFFRSSLTEGPPVIPELLKSTFHSHRRSFKWRTRIYEAHAFLVPLMTVFGSVALKCLSWLATLPLIDHCVLQLDEIVLVTGLRSLKKARHGHYSWVRIQESKTQFAFPLPPSIRAKQGPSPSLCQGTLTDYLKLRSMPYICSIGLRNRAPKVIADR